jgi:hypothetical protein
MILAIGVASVAVVLLSLPADDRSLSSIARAIGRRARHCWARDRAPRSAWWRRSTIAARRSLATPSIVSRRAFRERLGGAELEGQPT